MVGLMSEVTDKGDVVGLLQELGLKEYEARCFVALTQLPDGTAKQISEISEVPRTRVYDAIRVLEAQGLVEVQHADPKRFRAVTVEEAAGTLRRKYEDRITTLETQLANVEPVDGEEEPDAIHEVWSLTGHEAIRSRTLDLLDSADSEIALIVTDEEMLTDGLFDDLRAAEERGVTVILGGVTADVTSRLETELPGATVFQSELDWLTGPDSDTEVAIGRLLLVDRTTLLVSSFHPGSGDDARERAAIAHGLGNGLVVIIRRLLATGMLVERDPSR